MDPQVFEQGLSCVNHLRLQSCRPIVAGQSIHIVDMQYGGGWAGTTGEPPKSKSAFYLLFCKSYARMGGVMRYVQADNAAFKHHVYRKLMGDVT